MSTLRHTEDRYFSHCNSRSTPTFHINRTGLSMLRWRVDTNLCWIGELTVVEFQRTVLCWCRSCGITTQSWTWQRILSLDAQLYELFNGRHVLLTQILQEHTFMSLHHTKTHTNWNCSSSSIKSAENVTNMLSLRSAVSRVVSETLDKSLNYTQRLINSSSSSSGRNIITVLRLKLKFLKVR